MDSKTSDSDRPATEEKQETCTEGRCIVESEEWYLLALLAILQDDNVVEQIKENSRSVRENMDPIHGWELIKKERSIFLDRARNNTSDEWEEIHQVLRSLGTSRTAIVPN